MLKFSAWKISFFEFPKTNIFHFLLAAEKNFEQTDRLSLSKQQIAELEKVFYCTQHLFGRRRADVAELLSTDEQVVDAWFQRRREVKSENGMQPEAGSIENVEEVRMGMENVEEGHMRMENVEGVRNRMEQMTINPQADGLEQASEDDWVRLDEEVAELGWQLI